MTNGSTREGVKHCRCEIRLVALALHTNRFVGRYYSSSHTEYAIRKMKRFKKLYGLEVISLAESSRHVVNIYFKAELHL